MDLSGRMGSRSVSLLAVALPLGSIRIYDVIFIFLSSGYTIIGGYVSGFRHLVPGHRGENLHSLITLIVAKRVGEGNVDT